MAHEGGYGDSPHMRTIALSILIMGVSLAIVILLWIGFGWMAGSRFSDEIMRDQQSTLRDQYGLAPAEEITPKEAEIPPSLRHLQSQ
jgi:hypothetical protein